MNKTAGTFVENVDTIPAAGAATVSARTFAFDGNDTFTVGGISVGIDTFRAALSGGDTVTGNYTTDAGGVSTFAFTDANPVLTGTATAGTGAGSNDVTLAASFAAGSLDSVTIERASGASATTGFAAVTTVTPVPSATGLSYVDNDLATGSYTYRFTPVNDGDPGAA
ncbi:hypothetical protein ACFQ46_05010 [Kineococcus sp. GCM10028916]|uniref:hypothetical protein n=1 Tax=Kineococcus sp. GCM10028916 TaxID=3273394 RepID=UPI003635FC2B